MNLLYVPRPFGFKIPDTPHAMQTRFHATDCKLSALRGSGLASSTKAIVAAMAIIRRMSLATVARRMTLATVAVATTKETLIVQHARQCVTCYMLNLCSAHGRLSCHMPNRLARSVCGHHFAKLVTYSACHVICGTRMKFVSVPSGPMPC